MKKLFRDYVSPECQAFEADLRDLLCQSFKTGSQIGDAEEEEIFGTL